MIAWSIEAAKAAGSFSSIIVSTDDAEIAEVARNFGAATPFVRPAELADDYATTTDVVRHALDWLEEEGRLPDALCCLYATAPFVTGVDISTGHDLLPQAEFVVPVTTFAFPIQRALRMSEGRLTMFDRSQLNVRSQDLEEAWHDAGQFYWGTAAAWRAESGLFTGTTLALPLPRQRVQDIDTPEDWERAEAMFKAIR